MRIVSKPLEEYSKEELQREYHALIMKLNDVWINLDLRNRHRKDRHRKVENYGFDLNRLAAISDLLWYKWWHTDIYKQLQNDIERWFD